MSGQLEALDSNGVGTVNRDDEQPGPSALTPRHVLVVDDESVVRQVVDRVLARRYTTTLVGSVDEARRAIASDPPVDLVLCDLHMDGGGALELHEDLARSTSPLALSMVCMTGDTDEVTLDRLRGRGLRVLAKPFTPGALRQLLAEVLDHPS